MACIDYQGRYADFLALQKTFITNISKSGVSPKIGAESRSSFQNQSYDERLNRHCTEGPSRRSCIASKVAGTSAGTRTNQSP